MRSVLSVIYVLLSLFVIISCGKDDNLSENMQGNRGRKVSRILGEDEEIKFHYNNQGLISMLEVTSFYENETYLIKVTYSSDKIIAKTEYYDEYYGPSDETVVAELSKGKIAKIEEFFNGEKDESKSVFYRDDRIYLISSEEEGDCYFEWYDGNLVKFSYNSYSADSFFKYYNGLAPQLNIDLNFIFYRSEHLNFALCDPSYNPIFLAQNLVGRGSETLVKSIKENIGSNIYGYDYSYIMDDKGCPIQVVIKSSGFTSESISKYFITYID